MPSYHFRRTRQTLDRMYNDVDPRQAYAMKRAMEERNRQLIAEDREILKLGFCKYCYRILTTEGYCSSSEH